MKNAKTVVGVIVLFAFIGAFFFVLMNYSPKTDLRSNPPGNVSFEAKVGYKEIGYNSGDAKKFHAFANKWKKHFRSIQVFVSKDDNYGKITPKTNLIYHVEITTTKGKILKSYPRTTTVRAFPTVLMNELLRQTRLYKKIRNSDSIS
ncbi:MAG: hypothetical protein ACNI27_16820 [Desulfovibrio sp.]